MVFAETVSDFCFFTRRITGAPQRENHQRIQITLFLHRRMRLVNIQQWYLREILRQATLLTMFSLRSILNISKHSYKLGYQGTRVRSLYGRGGGWCNNLMSGVRVNEERKKQDIYCEYCVKPISCGSTDAGI